MLSKKISKLLNEQVTDEYLNAYLYTDMAIYYARESLDGFSHWFKIQAQEEVSHAELIVGYLQDNGVNVKLGTLEKPAKEYKSHGDPLQYFLIKEKEVTKRFDILYSTAIEEKDYRTMKFLDWFISEQNEEEANANTLIDKYKLFGGNSGGLYGLDSELGQRVYEAPSIAEE